MSRHHAPHRWRDRLPGRAPEPHFRWRGKEVSRLENLADAVFGFSVTLLVVALEAPKDFAGLRHVLEGFPAFIACFAMLMIFWNAHYRFFRRYGLEDSFTRTINYAILLIVIFAVYPLKFLFTVWFAGMLGFEDSRGGIQTLAELRFVFRSYGTGLALTWILFGLMYGHALRLRDQLQLTVVEVLQTRAMIASFAICAAVCFTSIALTFVPLDPMLPALSYLAIPPTIAVKRWYYRSRIARVLTAEGRRHG